MQVKKATKAGIDRMITKMIKSSDKAPKNWTQRREAMRKAGANIASDLKKQKMKLPWGLIFLAGVFIIAIIVFILWRSKSGEDEGGIVPGEKLDQPIDLRGRDTKGLLDDFGYK